MGLDPDFLAMAQMPTRICFVSQSYHTFQGVRGFPSWAWSQTFWPWRRCQLVFASFHNRRHRCHRHHPANKDAQA